MTCRLRSAAAGLAAIALVGWTGAEADDPRDRLAAIERTRTMLEEAGAALRSAESRTARVAALGQAVRAHEAALAALREGLRALAAEDRRLTGNLAAQHERLSALLGALQSLSRAPRSAFLAYPGGPVSASRAAAMMAEITPALDREVAELRVRLDTLRSVRTRQELTRAEARGTLAGLQALRGESARAVRGGRIPVEREALGREAEAAAARARDLDQLAAALRATVPQEAAAVPFAARRGTLPPPVVGQVTGIFGGVDPWGRTGQGITFTAPAYAQVTAPVDATVRYAGPLIDYGNVMILEPAEGWLMVLAGLANAEAVVGETVLEGQRLGDLGGPLPSSEEFLLEADGRARQIRKETLYVELRRAGEATDPLPWFATE